MKTNKGFTLIELVIAISLSSLIFAMLFTALWQTQKYREKADERQETAQKMRILVDRVSWLLKGAYPYYIKEEGKTLLYFSGTSSTIGFVTSSVDRYSESPTDMAGLKWITLSAGEDGLMVKENIYFLRENLKGEGGFEKVLDTDVKGIEFAYLTTDESGNTRWVNEWNPTEKDRLPQAVRFRISFTYRGKDISTPEITVGLRTNVF